MRTDFIFVTLVVIFFAVALPWLSTGSILSYGGKAVADQTYYETFVGQELTITTPFLGELSAGEGYDVCGSNDKDVIINNFYSISSHDLKLHSSTVVGGRGCSGNFITAKVTLPAGTLTGSCDLRVSTSANAGSLESYCSVYNKKFGLVGSIQDFKTGWISPYSYNTFTITLTEPTEVTISLNPDIRSPYTSVVMDSSIHFEPDNVVSEISQSFFSKIIEWLKSLFGGL